MVLDGNVIFWYDKPIGLGWYLYLVIRYTSTLTNVFFDHYSLAGNLDGPGTGIYERSVNRHRLAISPLPSKRSNM